MALGGSWFKYQAQQDANARQRNAARTQAARSAALSRQNFRQQAALTRLSNAAAPAAAPTTGDGLTDAARSAYGKAIDQYAPGGGFMKGIEAGIERGGTRAVASGMQGLVSAGMANTTQAGGLGKRYEEEVGAPTRAGAETTRMQSLASLYARLGGAEQGAFEGSAGRGLGYAQLGASQQASAGQLGLGYAQLGASQQASVSSGGGY